jgi:hypothetical protein
VSVPGPNAYLAEALIHSLAWLAVTRNRFASCVECELRIPHVVESGSSSPLVRSRTARSWCVTTSRIQPYARFSV